MRISAKAEYACLALMELAKPGSFGAPKRIREIAEAQGIPEPYLVQILQPLKAAGLVHSARGSVGGYHLSRRADAITVADVIRAIDGPGDPPRKTASPDARELSELFGRARDAVWQFLASATISQLAERVTPRDYVL